MGIVRDLYYARKIGAGTKLPAPTVALLIKRLALAAGMGGGVVETVSGNPAHITNALKRAAVSVLATISPIQSGSGDPSPDNVRPISGRTGLSVYVSPTQDQQDATTYAVDWTTEAGTVYAGHVNPVTGELVATYGMVDLGTLDWAGTGNSYFASSEASWTPYGAKGVSGQWDNANGISSIFSVQPMFYVTNADNRKDKSIAWYSNVIRIADKTYADATAFKTAMSGVQLCYELATPLTYQLSPQEVELLIGENYVWSSSGDTVSVTYYSNGNANNRQALNILLGGNYTNNRTSEDVSDKEALEIILGGNK